MRVHPDPHGELVPPGLYVPDARDPQHGLLNKYVCVIVEKGDVVGSIRRIDGYQHQLVRITGPHGQPQLANHSRKQGLGNTHPVLHVERRNIGIGPNAERHLDSHAAGTAAGTLHILHPRGAVHLFFNRDRDGLLYRLCVCAGIIASYRHTGRGDVRVLIDGGVEHGNETGNDQDQ